MLFIAAYYLNLCSFLVHIYNYSLVRSNRQYCCITYGKNAIVIKMSNMTEKCDRNKNEEHDGGVHRHARKYKKAIIKEWLCDMSELFRPFLAHGGDCLLQHHRLSFRQNRGDDKILNRAITRS